VPTTNPTPVPTPVPTPTPTPEPVVAVDIPTFELQRYIYAENDVTFNDEKFVIKIGRGIYYPLDFDDFVRDIIDTLEEQTGLSFYEGANHRQKLEITVSVDNPHAFGSIGGINIAQQDMFIDKGDAQWVFVHELSHTLQMRHCNFSPQAFMEGYATSNTQIMPKYLSSLNAFTGFQNYMHYENESDMYTNTEEYYKTVSGWDAYLFSFRFSIFLIETYGENLQPDFIRELQKKYGDSNITPDNAVSILKSLTSDNVFTDFLTWYDDNRDMFSVRRRTLELSSYDTFDVIPLYNETHKWYHIHQINYGSELTLDFREGYAYLQHMGHTVKGIYGSVYSSGSHTVNFYDADYQLLKTYSVNGSTKNLSVEDSVYIEITGDGSLIEFRLEYDSMID